MNVSPAACPRMLSEPVIDGSPFGPSVSLLTAVSTYVPASRRMVSDSRVALAELIAATRQAALPAEQWKSAARVLAACRDGDETAGAGARIATRNCRRPAGGRQENGLRLVELQTERVGQELRHFAAGEETRRAEQIRA